MITVRSVTESASRLPACCASRREATRPRAIRTALELPEDMREMLDERFR
jgi:hypothetical protein